MPSPRVGNIERQDSESEHIGPDYTGDNISAKKSANYVWNSGNSLWERMTQPVVSGGGTEYADGAARGTATGTVAMVDDGTNIQSLSGDSTGKLNVNNISGTVSLPTGASTSAKQDTVIAAIDTLESIFTDVIGFETTTNLASAATYSSGLLTLSPPYSQVLTNILSDRTGTMNVYWYSDVGGTDLVRTLTIAYTAGDGFLSFGAPAFTKTVKYEFTNSAGASTTDFYFITKFLTKALNGQLATLTAPLSTGMVANVTRSVIAGVTTGGGGTFVNVKVNPSGTLETNATLAAGTNNIGDVDVLTMPAITGTVTANAGTNLNTSALALAATQTDKSQFTKITDGTDTALVTAAGEQNVIATAQPGVDIGDVTINNAAGVSAVNIQDGGNSITVDGAVTTSGTVTEANSAAILTSTQLLDDTVATLGTTTYTETTTKGNIVGVVRRDADTTLVNTDNEVAPLQVNAGGQLKTAVIASALPTGAATSALQTTQDTSINTLLKPASTLAAVTTVGTVTNLSQQSGVAISIGTGVRDAGTQRVTIATNDVVPVTLTSTTVTGTVTTKETRSTTNTTATVAGSATVVTLIASNANRLGGTVYNDSSAILYVKLGATASTTDFTVTLSPLTSSIGGYFEVPFAYTGIITGVWASATGNARVGEIV